MHPQLLLFASDLTEIRPGLIVWTIITFLVAFVVLRWKAWGPILSLVEEREKQIQNAIDSAKRERAEAEKLLSEQKTAIAEARREASEMMRRNQAEVDRMREELIAKARKEADEARLQAQREIQAERQKAVAEIRGHAVELAFALAEKLIGEKLDDNRHRALAEQFIEQLPRAAQEQERLRP
jgi:F-type H+-transporting ATPase subunit b